MEMTNEVLAERVNNLLVTNSSEHQEIKTFITTIVERQDARLAEQDKRIDNHELRLTSLSNWRIGFVARFGTLSAIAIFLGSLVGTFVVQVIIKELYK